MTMAMAAFDPSKMRKNGMVSIIAKKGTGKLMVVENLLQTLKEDFVGGHVITPYYDTRKQLNKYVDTDCMHVTSDVSKITEILREIVAKRIVEIDETGFDKCPRQFIVLDDLMYDSKLCQSLVMRELAMNCRHFNFMIIVVHQYIHGMAPCVRDQVDYIFLGCESNLKHLERIHDWFFSMLSYDDFLLAAKECTSKKGRWLVADNTGATPVVADKLFYFQSLANTSAAVEPIE